MMGRTRPDGSVYENLDSALLYRGNHLKPLFRDIAETANRLKQAKLLKQRSWLGEVLSSIIKLYFNAH